MQLFLSILLDIDIKKNVIAIVYVCCDCTVIELESRSASQIKIKGEDFCTGSFYTNHSSGVPFCITLTSICNLDSLEPHFYEVKLAFVRVYIVSSFYAILIHFNEILCLINVIFCSLLTIKSVPA